MLGLMGTVVAMHRPGVFATRILTPASAVLAVVGVAIAAVGLQSDVVWLAVAGMLIRVVSNVWVNVVLGLSLATVSASGAAMLLSWAFVAKYVLIFICILDAT